MISPEERFRMKDEFGYEEIKQEKFKEGFQEGKGEGIAEGLQKAALAMLKKGLDPAFVSEVTGLSIEKLAKMCKS